MNTVSPPDGQIAGDALQALRAYRLPDPVAWWPPAPGWWMLAILMLAVIAGALWLLFERRRRLAAAKQAQQELNRLRHDLALRKDTVSFVRRLSVLLRRYALARFPRDDVAALTGEDWLVFLDAQGGNGRFLNGPGRHLADAPYRAGADVPAEQLAALVEDWIRCNRRARS